MLRMSRKRIASQHICISASLPSSTNSSTIEQYLLSESRNVSIH